jgi:sulfotransferase 6B1
MKYWLILVFSCLSMVLHAEIAPVYLLTIPKSGTHLITKYFYLLNTSLNVSNFTFEQSHLSETRLHLPKGYLSRPEIKKIILIRDPRDILCSALDHIEKYHGYLEGGIDFKRSWLFLSKEQKLSQLIDDQGSEDFVWNYHKRLSLKIYEHISRAVAFLGAPNCCLVRYENLVGPQGLGSVAAMRQEITMINDFMGLYLNEEEFAFIMQNLYGNAVVGTPTFNQGKIGRWRNEFTLKLKQAFKKRYGQILIDLGYEKDFDW